MNEILLLVNQYKPVAVCLKETFLKQSDNISLKSHTLYSKICT